MYEGNLFFCIFLKHVVFEEHKKHYKLNCAVFHTAINLIVFFLLHLQQVPPAPQSIQQLLYGSRGRGRGVLDLPPANPGNRRTDSEETMLADYMASQHDPLRPSPTGKEHSS